NAKDTPARIGSSSSVHNIQRSIISLGKGLRVSMALDREEPRAFSSCEWRKDSTCTIWLRIRKETGPKSEFGGSSCASYMPCTFPSHRLRSNRHIWIESPSSEIFIPMVISVGKVRIDSTRLSRIFISLYS